MPVHSRENIVQKRFITHNVLLFARQLVVLSAGRVDDERGEALRKDKEGVRKEKVLRTERGRCCHPFFLPVRKIDLPSRFFTQNNHTVQKWMENTFLSREPYFSK